MDTYPSLPRQIGMLYIPGCTSLSNIHIAHSFSYPVGGPDIHSKADYEGLVAAGAEFPKYLQ
jgi:hypothetical protein